VIIKSHLCGIAVRYEEHYEGNKRKNPYAVAPCRIQGSLYSQQKRRIADALEYMRTESTHKPIIFCATSPGYTDLASEQQLISKLTHNLRNGYSCKNFVWVRETTGLGYPHFHFVADVPTINVNSLSLYWSGLFGRDDNNSIRLGTSPKCNKCGTKLKQKGQPCYKSGCTGIGIVQYYLKGKKMSWYMSKYIGKGISGIEKQVITNKKKSFRTFHISKDLALKTEPDIYKSKMVRIGSRKVDGMGGNIEIGIDVLRFEQIKDEQVISYISEQDAENSWQWRYTGFANTYKGFPKEWKLKN